MCFTDLNFWENVVMYKNLKRIRRKQFPVDSGGEQTMRPVDGKAINGFRILRDSRPSPLHLQKNLLLLALFDAAASDNLQECFVNSGLHSK